MNFRPYLRYKDQIPLLVAFLFAAPILFFQAFHYALPLGYAGMFTLIAEKIAAANFALPLSIPHYGPGGIDLIYPPFAMYLFALAIKLGVPIWIYLKFVPALFSLLAIIPLYYLTIELVESRIASMLAVMLIVTVPIIYYTHVWSAGIVRAPAFCFCLTGLFFYLRSLREVSWRTMLAAGLFLGLTLITHWLYVLFAALAGLAFFLAERKISRLPVAAGILAIALLVAAPWLVVTLQRHGLSSVMMAYSSHQNIDFLHALDHFPDLLNLMGEHLSILSENKFLAALALPGLVLLLIQKKFHIPLAFFFVSFMGEATIYVPILAGMMAGAFGAEIIRRIPIFGWRNENAARAERATLVTLVVLGISLSSLQGLPQIVRYEPELDWNSFEVAAFVKEHTDPHASYLFVGKINEAEWFPYLLDRTPVFAPWGSEWKGMYAQQTEILIALRECELQKDWPCMESIQKEQSVSPDLLVVPNKRWLFLHIRDTHEWDLLYRGERYLVWERRN